jgi:5-methylcytosine-specific restriction endonuclease McrA
MQKIIEDLYYYCSEYFEEVSYRHLPRQTEKDKLKILALVLYNEISYWRYKGNRLQYGDLDNTDKVIEIITYNINIYKTNRRSMDIAKAKHKARVATIKSPLYSRWKHACKMALHKYRYCFKCKSILGLEIDHVKSRYTNPELEYDILNSQYLCKKCNQLKSSDSVDYRTEEIKQAQLEYIRIHHNGKSIVS